RVLDRNLCSGDLHWAVLHHRHAGHTVLRWRCFLLSGSHNRNCGHRNEEERCNQQQNDVSRVSHMSSPSNLSLVKPNEAERRPQLNEQHAGLEIEGPYGNGSECSAVRVELTFRYEYRICSVSDAELIREYRVDHRFLTFGNRLLVHKAGYAISMPGMTRQSR